jgi:DNA-binding Lrp family transcriptional regulator
VVRRLRGFTSVSSVYEVTGDHDISAFVNVENVAALNNLIEEIRTVPGVKRTETRMVLKKYNGSKGDSSGSASVKFGESSLVRQDKSFAPGESTLHGQ